VDQGARRRTEGLREIAGQRPGVVRNWRVEPVADARAKGRIVRQAV
jgi:hypothetical protein